MTTSQLQAIAKLIAKLMSHGMSYAAAERLALDTAYSHGW